MTCTCSCRNPCAGRPRSQKGTVRGEKCPLSLGLDIYRQVTKKDRRKNNNKKRHEHQVPKDRNSQNSGSTNFPAAEDVWLCVPLFLVCCSGLLQHARGVAFLVSRLLKEHVVLQRKVQRSSFRALGRAGDSSASMQWFTKTFQQDTKHRHRAVDFFHRYLEAWSNSSIAAGPIHLETSAMHS